MHPRSFALGCRIIVRSLPCLAPLLVAACGDSNDPTPVSPGPPSADVQVSVNGVTTAALGTEVPYTIRLTNEGPDTARQVALTSALSGDLDIVSISDDGVAANGVITWPPLPALAGGSGTVHTVVVRPSAEGTITARASATAETADPDAGNNDGSAATATVSTQVLIRADLQVAFQLPAAVDGGDTVTLTVVTRNVGPSPASDVVVLDSVPEAVAVVSASDEGTITGEAVTWPAAPSLAAGDSLVYQITLVAPFVGPLRSVHRAEGSSPDPVTTNDRVTPQAVITATPIATIQGRLVGEQFGWEVERIGDVDGDGAADLAISAPYGNGNGAASGRIYIHSGADGALLYQFDGEAGEWLGIDMDAGTDYDGDGVSELIVGAPAATGVNRPGRVYVFSLADGSTLKVLDGESPFDRFGWSAASAGDVNGDGVPDLYVGARDATANGTASGRAYVYSGQDWSLLFTVDGGSAGDTFGQAGGGVMDLDNDGHDDIAVGAPNAGNGGRGRVYVISGATGQSLFGPIIPDPSAANFGTFWIFSPGDLNQDGVPDIFASDINHNANGGSTGRAWVFSGVDGTPVLTLTGEAAGDQYGIGHPAGDLDGDGVPDLSIAAWLNSEGASQAGKVYLVSGATGDMLRTISSTTANENFGFDAFVVGDLTGDGVPDLAVSGGISGSTTGHVKLYAGVDARPQAPAHPAHTEVVGSSSRR